MSVLRILVACTAACASSAATAGAFLDFDGQPLTAVVHPSGVTSAGTDVEVRVCLAVPPASGDPEQAIRNVIATYNQDQPTLGNSVATSDGIDFESVLVHELGHCLGMDHNALGPSEVGTGDFDHPSLYYANSSKGGNGAFDIGDGVDNVRGTRDDSRGDDVNRVWYRKTVNDPWALPSGTIDRDTFTMSGFLPAGYARAEIASSFGGCDNPGNFASSSELYGEDPTQNVMFPVLCTSQHVRRLAPDDSTTLAIARAGYDGDSGTSDDYSVTLVFDEAGADCDISIQFVSGPGFANCQVGASGIPGSENFSITMATASFESAVNWFFNQDDTAGGGSPDDIFSNGFE